VPFPNTLQLKENTKYWSRRTLGKILRTSDPLPNSPTLSKRLFLRSTQDKLQHKTVELYKGSAIRHSSSNPAPFNRPSIA
jgi:hypothetical protein